MAKKIKNHNRNKASLLTYIQIHQNFTQIDDKPLKYYKM